VSSNVVAEYTGPHDRPLRKYPEIILPRSTVGAEYNEYRIDRSSEHVSGAYDGVHDLFNETSVDYADTWGAGWQGSTGAYSTSTGEHITYVTGGTTQGTGARLASNVPNGEWVSLKSPNAIKLDNIQIRSRNSSDWLAQFPTDFQIWGSNDGTTWSHIKTFTGQSASGQSILHTYHINSTIFYNRHALVVTKIPGTASTIVVSTGQAHFSISELRFYGHEEGSGSLDTTLKTVYNVPATTGTQLEVYYDAKDLTDGALSTTSGAITDLSPNTNNSTVSGDPQVSNGAFVFDGVGDYIYNSQSGYTVSDAYTASVWVKFLPDAGSSTDPCIFQFGNGSNHSSFGMISDSSENKLRAFIFGNNAVDLIERVDNVWYHLCTTYYASNGRTDFFINGILKESVTSGTAMTIPSTPYLSIGVQTDSSNAPISTTYFTGSIANFRLYSKALNADQIKELYDYQKDYFLGSKSQVTLYKGHLGVGVTEPSGQLELAGDERIQEYPPRGMTNPSTYIEGHGVFKAYGFQPHSDYPAWQAFDNTGATNGSSVWWSDALSEYSGTGDYSGSTRLAPETVKGAYIVLEMPYEIILKQIKFWQQFNGSHVWDRGVYYAKCNPSDEWTAIHNVTDRPANDTTPYTAYITDTRPYKYFAIVITRRHTAHATSGVSIRDLQFFGTPGPTTLDKGSLTLGRSLDVPRVSRYDVDTETPRPEKLVVDFDTTVNDSPIDISGNGNNGVLYNSSGKPTYSQVEKAFDFDGVNGVIYSGTLSPAMTGDRICSMSAWFKTTNASTVNQSVMWLGAYSSSGLLTVAVSNGTLRISIGSGCSLEVAGVIESNTWYHVVGIKQGTGSITSSNYSSIFKLYLNGEPMTGTFAGTTRTLNVTTNYWYIGAGGASGQEPFSGYISNPKLYDTILEPSEIRKLYNLGRTGRSMVISDTAVGIGKAPEAQLDVRGLIKGMNSTTSIAAWSVARSANIDNVSQHTAVYWDDVQYNVGGCYSNPRFTAPVSGYYYHSFHMITKNDAEPTFMGYYINDVDVDTNSDFGAYDHSSTSGGYGGHRNIAGSWILYLNAGDYIYMVLKDGSFNNNLNRWSGFFIST
jgi:hypothetical protein